MNVLGSEWYTQMGRDGIIGIVVVNNGYEEKAYIGYVPIPTSEESDEQMIAQTGSRFPLETAKSLLGI